MASLLPFAEVVDKFPSLLPSDSLQLPAPLKAHVESATLQAESPSELSSLLSEFELGHFILDLNFALPHPGQRPLVTSHVMQFMNDIESGLLGPYHQNSPLLVIATTPCPIVSGPGIWSHPVVNGAPVQFLIIAGQHRFMAIRNSKLWLKHWKCLVYRWELLEFCKPRTLELYMGQVNEKQTAMENTDDILLPSVINVLMACYETQKYDAAAKTIRAFPNRSYLNYILRMPSAIRPLRDLLINCPDYGQSPKFETMMKELGISRNPELVAMILETCEVHAKGLTKGSLRKLERYCDPEDNDKHWGMKRTPLRNAWYASDRDSWRKVFSGIIDPATHKKWVEYLPTLRDHPIEKWDESEFVQMGFEFHDIRDDFGMLQSSLMLTPRSFATRQMRDGTLGLPDGHPMKVIHIVNTILRTLIVILGDPQSLVSIMTVAKGVPLDPEQQYPMLALTSSLPFCTAERKKAMENIYKNNLAYKLVVHLLKHGVALWEEIEKHFPLDSMFKKLICGTRFNSEDVATLLSRDIILALYNLAHALSWHTLLKDVLCIQPGARLPGFPTDGMFFAVSTTRIVRRVQPLDPIASSSTSSQPTASTSSSSQGVAIGNVLASSDQPAQESTTSASATPPPPSATPSPPPPPSQSPIPSTRTQSVTPPPPSPTQEQTQPVRIESHTPPPPSSPPPVNQEQLQTPPRQTTPQASHATPPDSSASLNQPVSSPTPQRPPPRRRLEFVGVELSPMRPSSKRPRAIRSPEVDETDASSFAKSLAEHVDLATRLQQSKGKQRAIDIDADTRSSTPLSQVPSDFEDVIETTTNVDLNQSSSRIKASASQTSASSSKQQEVSELAVSKFAPLLNKRAFQSKHNIQYSLALKLLHAVSQLPEDVQLGLEHNINNLPAILQDSWNQGILSGPPGSTKDIESDSGDEEDGMEMD